MAFPKVAIRTSKLLYDPPLMTVGDIAPKFLRSEAEVYEGNDLSVSDRCREHGIDADIGFPHGRGSKKAGCTCK